MSATQTNFELNRIYNEVKQMGLLTNTQNIFVVVLVYTVMITAMLSALLGGVVMQVYYGIKFILNMFPTVYGALSKFYEASFDYENTYKNNNNNEETPVKKPLIDDTWCNVSVKNIINYKEDEVDEEEEEILSHKEISDLEEEILSLRSITSSNEVEENEVEENEVEENEVEENEVEEVETTN